MAYKPMYFGTKERMAWVKAPAYNADTPSVGWSATGTFLNGGAFVRSSSTAHKEYHFAWNLASQEDIDSVLDYALGLYGDGLLYFLDPFAYRSNLFPQYWAAPRLAVRDAPTLVTDQLPTLTATTSNTVSLPTMGATYTLHQGDKFLTQYFPIPPGYTLNLGAYGTSTGTAGVVVIPDGSATTVITRTQLVKNPNSVTTIMSNSGFGTGGAGTQTRTAGAGESGSYGAVMTWTTAPSAGSVNNRFGGDTATDAINVVAGTTITASLAVKLSVARSSAQGARVGVDFYTSAGVFAGGSLTGPSSGFTAGQEQRLYVSGTVPATATRALIYATMPDVTGIAIGNTFTASRPFVETGSMIGFAYFGPETTDNNSSPTTSAMYVDNGVINASTTTETTTIVSGQQQMSLLANTSSARTNTTVSGVTGATVTLRGTTGNITLNGLMAQVRPTGEAVPAGNFISGKGNSGVRFDRSSISVTSYSAPEALNLVGASATLIEVGAWEQ